MSINSYAKINFYLSIGKKVPSGYHNIKSVMQKIGLSDNISIEPLNEDKIIVECTNKELENEKNLTYKAALLLKEKFNVSQGVKIFIEKNIPIESGLGGGSSNAATILLALNKLWKIKLREKQLIELASTLGSDVPFFIVDNAALVQELGNKINPIKKTFSINILLINPGIRISTKWAYSMFDKQGKKPKINSDIHKLIEALEKKDIKGIAKNLHNDFEEIVTKKYRIVQKIKEDLLKEDALNATISGSGSTVFGVFNSIYEARGAFFKMKYDYPFVFLTKTI